MESMRVLFEKDNGNRQPQLRHSARAMESCIDNLCCTLITSNVLSDNLTALTGVIAVILLQCLYVAVFVRKGRQGSV